MENTIGSAEYRWNTVYCHDVASATKDYVRYCVDEYLKEKANSEANCVVVKSECCAAAVAEEVIKKLSDEMNAYFVKEC